MKKNLIFLLTFVALLGAASFASAIVLDNPLGANSSFATIITSIINYISGLVAALCGLMIVWAGILFVTSAGNPGKIETAKKILIYAVIGAAIALAADGLILLLKGIIGVGGSSGGGDF